MSIRGLTDRTRPPRLGKIRLGQKVAGQRGEYPKAADHFIFTDVPELTQMFGDNCKEIRPVILPVDSEEEVFVTSLSAYGRSGLFCRCVDGERAIRVNVGPDEKTGKPKDPSGFAFIQEQGLNVEVGEMFDLPCPGRECSYYDRGVCKELGRLLIMLPDGPRFGVYEIATSSINSILNITSSIRAVQAAVGRIAGVPFALRLVPLQVQPEGKAKTVYVLELEALGSPRQLAAVGRQLRAGSGALYALEAPTGVPDDLFPEAGAKLDRLLAGGTPPAPRSGQEIMAQLTASESAHDDDRKALPGDQEPDDFPFGKDEEPPPLTDSDAPMKAVGGPKKERVRVAAMKGIENQEKRGSVAPATAPADDMLDF